MIEKARRYVVVWDGFRAEEYVAIGVRLSRIAGGLAGHRCPHGKPCRRGYRRPGCRGRPRRQQRRSSINARHRLHLPFDMRAGYDSQTSGVSDPSQAVDQFFVDRSSFGRGELSEDIFADVEIPSLWRRDTLRRCGTPGEVRAPTTLLSPESLHGCRTTPPRVVAGRSASKPPCCCRHLQRVRPL